MAITLPELLERIKDKEEIYLLVSGEAVVLDREKYLVYIPESQYHSTAMNAFGSFKTELGHGLLWSLHQDVACKSSELIEALNASGCSYETLRQDELGSIARLSWPEEAQRGA